MPTIHTRYDRKRGCGWRAPGGLYLVAEGLARPCAALPIPLCRCPTCGNGIGPARGFTWIDAGALLAPAVALCPGPEAVNPDRFGNPPTCGRCPLSRISGQHGLVWIGGQFYRTPEDFTREVVEQGVSRRIAQLPRDLKIGETWVFVAHREAIEERCPDHPMGFVSEQELEVAAQCQRCKGTGRILRPAIFHAFKPTAVEYVVKPDDSEEYLERLEKRGLTLVRIERVEEQPALVEVLPDDVDDGDYIAERVAARDDVPPNPTEDP